MNLATYVRSNCIVSAIALECVTVLSKLLIDRLSTSIVTGSVRSIEVVHNKFFEYFPRNMLQTCLGGLDCGSFLAFCHFAKFSFCYTMWLEALAVGGPKETVWRRK